jgi:hypothetical protein
VSLLDGVPFFWESRNPQATSEYGFGFARELGVSGGFYDTWINLRDYYENGLTVGGVGSFGPLLATVRITEFDWGSGLETPPRVSWTESTQAETAEASPNGLILGVTPATGAVGTGFSAPAIQLPFTFIDPDTGGVWYDYSGLENPAGLTFGFTRATGIFKGAFNVYYDYVSADDRTTGRQTVLHVVKKALFEGALTPVRADGDAEGRGFFPWADTGWYDSGRFDGNGEPILIAYPFSRSCDLQLIRP